MNETQYLLMSLGSGPYKKKSYESDLSKLPEKHQPKYKANNAFVGGLAGGFAGDWPGMKLRRTGDNPDFKYDYYNPLARDAKPNEFGSPEEQLDYEMGQGTGQLGAAATLLPALVKQGGRTFLSALAGRNLRAEQAGLKTATEEAAHAADYIGTHTPSATGKSGLTIEEALQQANEAAPKVLSAGNKVNAARAGLEEAGQFGKSLDPAIAGSNRLLGAKLVAGGVDSLLGGARDSVQAEDDNNFSVDAIDQPRTYGFAPEGQPVRSPGGDYASAFAGRQQIKPYEEKRGLLEKIAYALFPEEGRRNEENHRRAYLQDEIMRQGYIDPETQYKLQELSADKGLERSGALQGQQGNLNLRNSLAPAMKPSVLDQLIGAPSGTIDERRLDRMTRQRDESELLQLLMAGGLNLGGPALATPAQPVVNVPRR